MEAIKVDTDFQRCLKNVFLILSWPGAFVGRGRFMISQTPFRLVRVSQVGVYCSGVAFETIFLGGQEMGCFEYG